MGEFEEFEYERTKSKKTESMKKNIAGFIDGIMIILIYCISFFSNISFFTKLSDSYKILYIFVLFIIYRLITIISFNRTIGMILIGIEFAKETKTELNLKEKLLTIIMVYVNGTDCFDKK